MKIQEHIKGAEGRETLITLDYEEINDLKEGVELAHIKVKKGKKVLFIFISECSPEKLTEYMSQLQITKRIEEHDEKMGIKRL